MPIRRSTAAGTCCAGAAWREKLAKAGAAPKNGTTAAAWVPKRMNDRRFMRLSVATFDDSRMFDYRDFVS